MDARDRDVRPPPAALVRSRSRHPRADGRDRSRGPPPGVGAVSRLDRRREGGPAAAARISAATGEWKQAERSTDYLLSGVRLAQAEEATRDDAIRLTDNEREFLDASIAHRDAGAVAERDAPRARARPRAPRANTPSWTRRRAGGGACPRRLADGRLRSAGAVRANDGATNPRSPRSRPPPSRTSTSTRRPASSWRCMP